MRPNAEELLRGIQRSLMSYVLPEVQSDHARAEIMFSNLMLSVLTRDLDGAAQLLVDDNASLRELARNAAAQLAASRIEPYLATELSRLAGTVDSSVRLSDLAQANRDLVDATARLAVLVEGSTELAGLRETVVNELRSRAERVSHSMLGPRADG